MRPTTRSGWLESASAALLLGALMAAGGCGGGEPARLTLDQLSAAEVEELLRGPMGGLGFDGFMPEVLEELPRDLLPGICGLPPIDPDCQQGMLGGRWRALGGDLGVFFGLWSGHDRDSGGFVGGIYGHGKLFGMVVGDDGEAQALLSGRYDGASFSGELIERGERRAGQVNGSFSPGRFSGRWQRCIGTPPRACIEDQITAFACLPSYELREMAEAQCAARGMVLTSHTLSANCGGGYPDAGVEDAGIWYADAWLETDGGYADGGYADGGYADGGYADGGYADGGYADGGYADGGYADGGYADGGYADGGYADAWVETDGGYADAGVWQDVGVSDGGPVGPMPRYRPSERPYPYLYGHHQISFTCCAQDPVPPVPAPEPCVAHEMRMERCQPEYQLRSQADQICEMTDSFVLEFAPVGLCADPWRGARPAADPLPRSFSGAGFLCCVPTCGTGRP